MPDSTVLQQTGENHAATVRETISRNVAIDIAGRIGYLLSRFLIPPFVLAHVTLEAYGLWATAFIVVSYIGVSTLGVSNVYIKYVAEYSARREYNSANRLLSTGFLITVPLCTVVFGLLWLFWPTVVDQLHVAPALRGDAREVVLSVVAIFLASIALSGFRDALTGVQKSSQVQLVWVVAYSVETVLIFTLVGMGRGIRGLAEAFLIRTVIEISLAAFIAFRTLPWLRISPALFSREALKLLVSFGGMVQLQCLIAIALNSIERAIAAPLVGLQATGLLDIGKKLPSMAGSIPSAFASAFVPAASYLYGGLEGSAAQRESIRKLYLKGARYMNLSAAYVCGLLAAVPLPLLDVWMGKRYAGAAYLMVIFSVSTQVHLMTGPGTSILKGIGRPREEFFYGIPNIVALLIALPLCRLLLGQWTTLGIGTAVACSTVVSAACFLWHSNRLLEVSLRQYSKAVIFPGIVPYLIALPLAWPVQFAVEHVNRWNGAGVVLSAGILYTLVLLFVVDRLIWESGERLWFHAIVANRLPRLLPTKVGRSCPARDARVALEQP
jgi:O-antigen/teichoic acid export membrane protein